MEPSNQSSPNTNEEETYISFSRIFKYLKKCLPMIAISCLVFVICVVVAIGAYYAIKSDNYRYAEGILELTFNGIEDGKDPYGNTFDPQTIKSTNNISAVLTTLGVDYSTQDVRNAITVEGFLNKETIEKIQAIKDAAKTQPALLAQLNDIKQHPTKFLVRIDYNSAKVKKADALRIIDELMLQYGTYFKVEYQKGNYFSTSTFTENVTLLDSKTLDYMEVYDNLSNEIESISSYLQAMAAKNTDYRSNVTHLKFKDLHNELLAINSILSNFKALVVDKGITIDLASTKAYLSNQKNDYASAKSSIEENIEKVQKIISEYKQPTIIVGEKTDVSVQTPAYDEMHKTLIDLAAKLASTDLKLKEIEYRQKQYDSAVALSPEEMAEITATAKGKLVIVKNSMVDLVTKINSTVNDFTQTHVVDNAVNVSVVAGLGEETTTGGSIMVYGVIAALFAGFIVGMPLTAFVEKVLKKKAAKKLATPTTPEA